MSVVCASTWPCKEFNYVCHPSKSNTYPLPIVVDVDVFKTLRSLIRAAKGYDSGAVTMFNLEKKYGLALLLCAKE